MAVSGRLPCKIEVLVQNDQFNTSIAGIEASISYRPPQDYDPKECFNIAKAVVGRMPMAPSDLDHFFVSLRELAKRGVIEKHRLSERHRTRFTKPLTADFAKVEQITDAVRAELDKSQQQLFDQVIDRNLGGMVPCEGPPGTGKSPAAGIVTACATMLGAQCLVVTHSNVAADNMCLAVARPIPIVNRHIAKLIFSGQKLDLNKCRAYSPFV